MADLFKEWIPSILQTKVNHIHDEFDEKDYAKNSFMINRALSLHPDCIFYANEMNMHYRLPARAQYAFLLQSVRSKKRGFKPWPKKQNNKDVNLLMKHFNYSRVKAISALQILTEDQLKIIRKMYEHI